MRQEFEARRDLVCDRLTKMPGVKLPRPDGAFYAFFDVSAHFGRTFGGKPVTDSLELLPGGAWSRPMSTSCPARRSARRASCGCRSRPAASRSRAGWTRLEKFLGH